MSNLLYKYLDINGAKMMLHYRNLMYANATTFNDPLDCHPSLIDFSNVPEEECKTWPADTIESLRKNKHNLIREKIWICCLSKLYNSILMWSYYNKHEGICVGLNMDKVVKYLNPMLGQMVITKGIDVQYTDIVKKPNYYRDNKDFFKYQVFTKAKVWEHEQEVRLFIYDPNSICMGLLPFQKNIKSTINWKEVRAFPHIGPECFETIYLGVKINVQDKDTVIKLAKNINPNIKVYQMNIDANNFSLIESEVNKDKTLSSYLHQFSNLHRNKLKGEIAPHKPIMLLSVMDLIEAGFITSNKIEFSEMLEERFKSNWKRYVKTDSVFKPNAGTPFWHLSYEPFWRLVPFCGGEETLAQLKKSNPYSSGTIRKNIRYAEIDIELFELMKDVVGRKELKQCIMHNS